MGIVFFSEGTSTAGKNLPYKGSPSTGTRTFFGEVEDTEDNNGERGNYKLVEVDGSQNYFAEGGDTEDNNGKQKRDAKNDCPPETFWHRDKKKCVTWRCINLLCLQLENFAIEG